MVEQSVCVTNMQHTWYIQYYFPVIASFIVIINSYSQLGISSVCFLAMATAPTDFTIHVLRVLAMENYEWMHGHGCDALMWLYGLGRL